MFGKGGEPKEGGAATTKTAAGPKISNIKSKPSAGLSQNDTEAKKTDDSSLAKEVEDLHQRLDQVRYALSLNEDPVKIVSHLRQMFGIEVHYAEQMHTELHKAEVSGNPMDIETTHEVRDRIDKQLDPETDLMMDEDVVGIN